MQNNWYLPFYCEKQFELNTVVLHFFFKNIFLTKMFLKPMNFYESFF